MHTHFYLHPWPGRASKAGLAVLLASALVVLSFGAMRATAQSSGPQQPLPAPGGPNAAAGSAFTYLGRLNDSGGTPFSLLGLGIFAIAWRKTGGKIRNTK